MKPYRLNPRQISQKHLASLRDSLESLGDLSGIVENVAPSDVAPVSSGQVVGGHQRLRAMFGEEAGEFALSDADIEIIRSYDCPTEQGTIAEGFIIWRGARFAFRRVVWDDETFKRANFAANQQAGEWNWDMFANTIGADDLTRWGYDPAEWLAQLNRDAGAVSLMAVDTISNEDAAFDALPSRDRAPFQQMTFTLHDLQVETVMNALKISKSFGEFVDTGNENSNGNALARICEIFIKDYGNR